MLSVIFYSQCFGVNYNHCHKTLLNFNKHGWLEGGGEGVEGEGSLCKRERGKSPSHRSYQHSPGNITVSPALSESTFPCCCYEQYFHSVECG